MIKVLEKDYLDDNFIIKPFLHNIKTNETMLFDKKNTYYFGNYKEEKLDIIRKKVNKNKKRIINAIENGTKFIIYGNSINIFNNSFNHNNINLFTSYNKNKFKNKFGKLIIKKKYKNNNIAIIDNIKNCITTENFRYKNLICIKKESKKTFLPY